MSITLIFGEVLNLPPELLVILAGLVMIFHMLSLVGCHDSRICETPLLLVLHLGYDLLIVGYGLTAQAKFRGILPFLATHVFTTGGIGMVTLGMIALVSLGHSGRSLQQPVPTILAFVLLTVSLLLRVAAPSFFPSAYGTLILLYGSVCILAFTFFLWNYFPILAAPGINGRLG